MNAAYAGSRRLFSESLEPRKYTVLQNEGFLAVIDCGTHIHI